MFTVIQIPDTVKTILRKLTDAGFEAYAVGGCVRDSLLGRIPHDWDICTSALPEQVESCFGGYHVIETGLKHGTVTVMKNGEPYEITTFRQDGDYADHRHPDKVSFVQNLQEDLTRRDFTINAMAADVSGRVIDYFGGLGDLDRGIIRCVGNPNQRFQEDALRILRALRFASRYGFSIEERTKETLFSNKILLHEIANERINKELAGILTGDCFDILREFHEIFSLVIPEIEKTVGFQQNNPYHYLDIWEHTALAIANAPKDRYVRLALLYHDLGKPECYTCDGNGIGHFYGHWAKSAEIARRSMRDLRFDKKTIQIVVNLVENHDREISPEKRAVRRCLNRFGKEQLIRLLYMKDADQSAQIIKNRKSLVENIVPIIEEIEADRSCFSIKDLAVNGRDLIEIGYQEGKDIGGCLNHLLSRTIDGTVENQKDALLNEAKRYRKLLDSLREIAYRHNVNW